MASDSKFDWAVEQELYRALRSDYDQRNRDWWVLRQAFQGIYRWPADWPDFKEKLRVPLIRKMVLTHAAFLVGRRWTHSMEPLKAAASARKKATEAERALGMLYDECDGWASVNRAALLGSLLGTSGFKTYLETDGRPCFTAVQPELCYPITRGDDYTKLVKVFYGYAMDRRAAAEQFSLKPDALKSVREVEQQFRPSTVPQGTLNRSSSAGRNYVVTGNYAGAMSTQRQQQQVPVLEVWEKDRYALFVGGEEVENGDNPYGFIPYVLIPNIDAGFGPFGESDVDQVLELNEELNRMIADWTYTMHRWANPTLLWERAPKNYVDIVAKILGGGGVIPLPVGSRLSFLEYAGQTPDFAQLMDRLRGLGVELSGLNELAFSGESGGSINTGASLAVNFTNVVSTQSLKQTAWESGIKELNRQLLELGSRMKDVTLGISKAVGAGSAKAEGIVITGDTIGGHRRVKVLWPGLLPKDSEAATRLEIEKMTAGVQSRYTTIENVGAEFPEDELERIATEQADPRLNPEGAATQTRANAMQTVAQAKAAQLQQGGAAGDPTAAVPGDIEGDGDVPDDLGQVTDTGEDFGTGPDGQVRDANGRALDETGAGLARFFAENGRGARGAPTEEGLPPEENDDEEQFAELL